MASSEDLVIYLDEEAEKKYLSLDELGNALKCLTDILKGDVRFFIYNNNSIKKISKAAKVTTAHFSINNLTFALSLVRPGKCPDDRLNLYQVALC